MSDPIQKYEDDWKAVSSSVSRKINVIPTLFGDRKIKAISDAEKEISEAETLLRNFDRDIRGSLRAKSQPKLQAYQADLQTLKASLRKVQYETNTARDSLGLTYGSRAADRDVDLESADQRTRILSTTEIANRTMARLENTERVALNNQAIGVEVANTLAKDRDTLLRAEDKLSYVDENVADSRRILKNMARRVVTNRLILIGIILVLLGAIGLVVYFSWRHAK